LFSVLHVAARSKQNFALKTLLRALREYGCASDLDSIINAVNARGQTPLHCAVRAGDTDCVHYLLASGARKDMPDNNMNTVIHYLGEVYNDDIYKEIIERSNEENQIGDEEKKENPLAIKNGEGCTPVHIAVRKLKLGLLETLIEAGAPLDIADKNGETPLITALILNDIDSANLLIQSKCNVNAESQNGETPLMLACQLKNLKLIGRLIDAGADPHYANIDGKKPVDIEDSDVQKILNGERIVESDIDSTASDNNALCSSNDRSIDEQSSPPSIHRLRRIRTDDISSLDYVTRLRLSKLLDVENKWEILADHLGCSHMTQFISVCIDESSSPTMMLLDQYEQIPNANLATIIQALERMGELIGANLIKDGNE
uniref:ANK_REP_REGION domain-containing protein n=1 Tax=Dracunculus medinensis TaxID=318479 RepID=A0A0N4UIV4_DRAME